MRLAMDRPQLVRAVAAAGVFPSVYTLARPVAPAPLNSTVDECTSAASWRLAFGASLPGTSGPDLQCELSVSSRQATTRLASMCWTGRPSASAFPKPLQGGGLQQALEMTTALG